MLPSKLIAAIRSANERWTTNATAAANATAPGWFDNLNQSN